MKNLSNGKQTILIIFRHKQQHENKSSSRKKI